MSNPSDITGQILHSELDSVSGITKLIVALKNGTFATVKFAEYSFQPVSSEDEHYLNARWNKKGGENSIALNDR